MFGSATSVIIGGKIYVYCGDDQWNDIELSVDNWSVLISKQQILSMTSDQETINIINGVPVHESDGYHEPSVIERQLWRLRNALGFADNGWPKKMANWFWIIILVIAAWYIFKIVSYFGLFKSQSKNYRR